MQYLRTYISVSACKSVYLRGETLAARDIQDIPVAKAATATTGIHHAVGGNTVLVCLVQLYTYSSTPWAVASERKIRVLLEIRYIITGVK